MRINLGCGLVYKKGFVNVDGFDSTVADSLMPMVKLDFVDNIAEVIECSQVLEHLGSAKCLYALAECFRILKPGGTLMIETPDIENAFRTFLKKGEKQRKHLMTWIYGLDSPGMVHRFCFPKDLLYRILKQSGFENIQIQQLGKGSLQPTLRATCRKPQTSRLYQILAWTRSTIVNEGFVDLDNQVITLDQEVYLQKLVEWGSHFVEGVDEDQFQQMIIEVGVHAPNILIAFLQEGIRGQLFSSSQVAEAIQVLRSLTELDFPVLLLHLFQELPIMIGSQHQSFASVMKMGRKTIEKLLTGNTRSKILKELQQTKNEISESYRIQVFTEAAIQQLANQQFAIAAKFFALMNLSEAINRFLVAFRLDRDNLLIPWNLGRIFGLQGDIESTRAYFDQAEKLVQKYTLTHRRQILHRLQTELETIQRGEAQQIAEPVFHPFTL